MYLCCDLGGSIADWAVYDPNSANFIFRKKKEVSFYEDFYEMMDNVLEEYSKQDEGFAPITNTTLGIAGPTDHDIVSVTNIEGWEINIRTVNDILEEHEHNGFSSIINDFEALGYGILHLFKHGFNNDHVQKIYGRFKTGPARQGESRGTRSLVCGPGTGLGVASVVEGLQKEGFPYIISSEGGHHTMAPENAEQLRFLMSSGKSTDKISYEDILSHAGLRELYNYFRREDYSAEPNYSITSEEIILLARSGGDQAAIDSIELFCELLANFCGNTALTFNTDNTIFLWGGVLLKMPIDLLTARFKRDYANRCNHSTRISRVPVVLMQNEDLPLLGCVHRSEFEIEHKSKN